MAAKGFDDIEEEWNLHTPLKVNRASALLMAAQGALARFDCKGITKSRYQKLVKKFTHMGLLACAGQDEVLERKEWLVSATPDDWLRISQKRSGEPFAWAAWSGSWISGAPEHFAEKVWQFGYHLGVLIQLADDFTDVWFPGSSSDLATGHFNLPLIYGLYVAEKETREHLVSVCRRAKEGNKIAEKEAQDILISLGAQKFILTVGFAEKKKAICALSSVGCEHEKKQCLFDLLDKIFPILPINEGK